MVVTSGGPLIRGSPVPKGWSHCALLPLDELLRLREPQKWVLRRIWGLGGYTEVSASYHPYTCPLGITPYIHIYIWVRGDTQRTPRYTLLDPKLAVESISEVPGASKAHRGVVNRAVP